MTTTGSALARFDPDAPLFLISTAARLAGMHPQTLRTYDRMGLVSPTRTRGRGRRYTIRDVERLRLIQSLSHDEGINLAGVRRIMALSAEVERLQAHVNRLMAGMIRLNRASPSSRLFTVSGQEAVFTRRDADIEPDHQDG